MVSKNMTKAHDWDEALAAFDSVSKFVVETRALRERPLLDFIKNVLPKLIAMLGGIDIEQIMKIVKIITDLFGSIAPAPAAQGVAAMTCVPGDADIEAAIKTTLADSGTVLPQAIDFGKLLELIKLILAIFFPKPATP